MYSGSVTRVAFSCVCLVVLAAGLAGFGRPAAAENPLPGFDVPSKELGDGGKTLAKRFEQALARYKDESADESRCRGAVGYTCGGVLIARLASDLQGRSRSEQVHRVNRFFNQLPYVTDEANWGATDYWASPAEFLGRGGDCEDFVIAKYLALRAVGFAASDLRILIVRLRRTNEVHAVLIVNDGEGLRVLDNYYASPRSWPDMANDFEPLYSLNETSVWLHVKIG